MMKGLIINLFLLFIILFSLITCMSAEPATASLASYSGSVEFKGAGYRDLIIKGFNRSNTLIIDENFAYKDSFSLDKDRKGAVNKVNIDFQLTKPDQVFGKSDWLYLKITVEDNGQNDPSSGIYTFDGNYRIKITVWTKNMFGTSLSSPEFGHGQIIINYEENYFKLSWQNNEEFKISGVDSFKDSYSIWIDSFLINCEGPLDL